MNEKREFFEIYIFFCKFEKIIGMEPFWGDMTGRLHLKPKTITINLIPSHKPNTKS